MHLRRPGSYFSEMISVESFHLPEHYSVNTIQWIALLVFSSLNKLARSSQRPNEEHSVSSNNLTFAVKRFTAHLDAVFDLCATLCVYCRLFTFWAFICLLNGYFQRLAFWCKFGRIVWTVRSGRFWAWISSTVNHSRSPLGRMYCGWIQQSSRPSPLLSVKARTVRDLLVWALQIGNIDCLESRVWTAKFGLQSSETIPLQSEFYLSFKWNASIQLKLYPNKKTALIVFLWWLIRAKGLKGF